jgi:hypothetical protein
VTSTCQLSEVCLTKAYYLTFKIKYNGFQKTYIYNTNNIHIKKHSGIEFITNYEKNYSILSH